MPKHITKSQISLIVEYYFIHKIKGFKSIAEDLEISQNTLKKYVKDYSYRGFMILPSKMN